VTPKPRTRDREILRDCVPSPKHELEALRAFARFGAWALREHRLELGDLDGGSIQDEAIVLGLLHHVPATERCGENCFCAEWDDFPQDCLRLTPAAHEFAQAMEEKP
jgi:hypothetical protein